MREHLIFHKYTWETYHTSPVFVTGFFKDYTLERRFQVGECKCGANKYREIDVDIFREMDIQFIDFKIKTAEELKKQGKIAEAIEVLKIS